MGSPNSSRALNADLQFDDISHFHSNFTLKSFVQNEHKKDSHASVSPNITNLSQPKTQGASFISQKT